MTELYKFKNRLSSESFAEIFARETKSHYNLRQCSDKLVQFIKLWNILPNKIKQENSLNSFKKSVKKWNSQDYPCRLCNAYINGVGFL